MSENYLQHADHFSRILSTQEVNKSSGENNNVIEQSFKKSNHDFKTEENKENSLPEISKTD